MVPTACTCVTPDIRCVLCLCFLSAPVACMNDCNGHGICRSMRRSAEHLWHSTSQIAYTNVWDANMIWGCNCDEGWEGADCSLQTCIRSDDPLTSVDADGAAQVNEMQFIECQATGGFFTVKLDNRISEQIPWDATLQQVKDLIHVRPRRASLHRLRVVMRWPLQSATFHLPHTIAGDAAARRHSRRGRVHGGRPDNAVRRGRCYHAHRVHQPIRRVRGSGPCARALQA